MTHMCADVRTSVRWSVCLCMHARVCTHIRPKSGIPCIFDMPPMPIPGMPPIPMPCCCCCFRAKTSECMWVEEDEVEGFCRVNMSRSVKQNAWSQICSHMYTYTPASSSSCSASSPFVVRPGPQAELRHSQLCPQEHAHSLFQRSSAGP